MADESLNPEVLGPSFYQEVLIETIRFLAAKTVEARIESNRLRAKLDDSENDGEATIAYFKQSNAALREERDALMRGVESEQERCDLLREEVDGLVGKLSARDDTIARQARTIAQYQEDARKWYRPGGAFEFLGSPEDVIERRKRAAEELERLREAIRRTLAEPCGPEEISRPLQMRLRDILRKALSPEAQSP